MLNFIKIVTLLAVCFLSIIEAEKMYGIDDFDPAKATEIRELAQYIEKLEYHLFEKVKKLPQLPARPEKVIELAKNELHLGCFGVCLTSFSEYHRSRQTVIKLFVSLENTIDNCETESYEILASNLIVWEAFLKPFESYLTYGVLQYYLTKHAQFCWPINKKRFSEKLSNVAESDQRKIEKALSTLNVTDFDWPDTGSVNAYHYFGLVGMPQPTISTSSRALEKIVQQLKLEANDTTSENADEQGTSASQTEGLYNFLHSELFEPCENYRRELSAILNGVRIDGANEDDEAKRELLHGGESLHSALINNRICGFLLNEQQELYPLMANVWLSSNSSAV